MLPSEVIFPLTEEQREIQRTAREFAAAEITPFTAQWDRDSYFEPTLVKKLGDLGFLGMLIPEQYDGLGLDALTYLMALEEISIRPANSVSQRNTRLHGTPIMLEFTSIVCIASSQMPSSIRISEMPVWASIFRAKSS